MFPVMKVPVPWLPPQVIRKKCFVNACSAREYHRPLLPSSARLLPATNTRCSPLPVASARLSRFDPANRAGSTSCASGTYDGDSLTSTVQAFVSGAVYASMACVAVTPLTCTLTTAPYATDAVRTIIDNLIWSILNVLQPR